MVLNIWTDWRLYKQGGPKLTSDWWDNMGELFCANPVFSSSTQYASKSKKHCFISEQHFIGSLKEQTNKALIFVFLRCLRRPRPQQCLRIVRYKPPKTIWTAWMDERELKIYNSYIISYVFSYPWRALSDPWLSYFLYFHFTDSI